MTLAPLASLSLAGAMFAADAPPSVKVLSLATAEETALRHQPTLEQAFGQVEAAEGRVEQARAGYLPQLNGAATYQRTTANFAPRPGFVQMGVNVPPTGGWSAQTFNFFTFSATATQLIYDFGLTSDRWRSANASRDAASWNRRAIENQTLLNVRRAFFLGRAQRDLVAVA